MTTMHVPDLQHTIGRCVLALRAYTRQRNLERILWWSQQLRYARSRESRSLNSPGRNNRTSGPNLP